MNTTLSQIFDDLLTANPYVHSKKEESARTHFRPAVNINETPDTYLMEFNIPGIAKEAINIEVEEKTLTVSYNHEEPATNPDEKIIKREFSKKSFKRTFTLGDTINIDQIVARFENGILLLTLPKNEKVEPMKKTIVIE